MEQLDPIIRREECVEARRCLLRPGEHLVDRLAVLAGEHRQGRPAVLDILEALRVELHVLEVAGEFGRQIGHEGGDLVDPGVEGTEPLVMGGPVRQRGPGRPDEVTDVGSRLSGILIPAEVGQRPAGRQSQAVSVREALVLGTEHGVLTGLRVDRLDLLE